LEREIPARYDRRVDEDDQTPPSIRRDLLAEEVLAAILDAVAQMAESPQKRQLGAKALSYKRTLEQWRATRPTPAQRDALHDMVIDLQAKLMEVLRRDSLDLTPGTGIRAVSSPSSPPPPPTTAIARIRKRSSDGST
jgi:hypothetical protein